jgi:hypothetical protein
MKSSEGSTHSDWRGDTWLTAVEAFKADHPRRAILLLMRFDESPLLQSLREAIQAVADRLGYDVIRADDRDYTGELWANVDLCVRNTDLVIALLEDVERRDCDANVMVEVGYVLALSRPCLLLTERRIAKIPAVLRHRVMSSFDAYDPTTVERAVERWMTRDLRRM